MSQARSTITTNRSAHAANAAHAAQPVQSAHQSPTGMLWLAHALALTQAKHTLSKTRASANHHSTLPEPTQTEPTQTDLAMMDRALALAQAAAIKGEVPVGAVVYHTGTGAVVSFATNTRETLKDPAGHAEFDAIRAACAAINDWRLNDYTLVVTLEPCPMCAGLIVNARVGRVVFGARDPKAGAVRSLLRICDDPRLNHRSTIIEGVHATQCAAELAAFFAALRARKKKVPHSNIPHHR